MAIYPVRAHSVKFLPGIIAVVMLQLGLAGCSDRETGRGGDLAWFTGSNIYNGWYQPRSNPPEDTVITKFPLIVWSEAEENLDLVRRYQRMGVRSIPYISYYKIPRLSREPGEPEAEPDRLASPFWRAVDWSNHPEWVLIGPDGVEKQPFNNPDYPYGYRQCCSNSPGYAEAVEKGVRALMEQGYDGVFLDNVHPEEHCYGPQFGRHQHVYPDETNIQTYIRLIKRMQEVIKSYGSDKLIVFNPGGPDKRYSPYCDAMMWESYICSWAWVGRSLTWGGSGLTWDQVKEGALEWEDYRAEGKRIVALAYLHDFVEDPAAGFFKGSKTDNAFFTYACALYSGFMWADWFTLGYDPARALYNVRLGDLIGDMIDDGDLHYRQFERGLVAINSGDAEYLGKLPVRADLPEVMDVYENKARAVVGGEIEVSLPPRSGRVYWSGNN